MAGTVGFVPGNSTTAGGTVVAPPPGVPLDFTATPFGDHSIVLAWNAPTPNGSEPVTNYTIKYAAPPSAPLSFTATAGYNGEVALNWEPPTSDGGEDIAGYTITWSEA